VSLPLALLAALVGLGIALRTLAALALPAPFLFPDEGAYALLGRGLWHHADLAVLGGPSSYVSALYPVFSALPYGLLRVLQAIALCGTGIVVYVWARWVAGPVWALAAAALTLTLPGLVYAGTITAEALLFPLAALAGWLAVRAVVSPTFRNQGALVVALAACALTRGEANTLVLALLAAAALAHRARALWPTWAAAAAFCAAWLALGGRSPLRSLEGYDAGGYSTHGIVVWILEQAGEFVLVCGAVPLCSAILLALHRPLDLQTRTTANFALALAAVTAVETGVFAAGHAGHLLEREVLFALPPLFVAFAGWLSRAAPRPPLVAVPVVVAAVAALLAMPFGRLVGAGVVPDNPTLVPLTHLDSPKVYGTVALFALAAGILTLWLPPRALWLLPTLLVILFAATSASASEEFTDRAQAARLAYTAPTASWIERHARGPVTYLYDGSDDWRLVWSQLFWNERIAHVLDLPATHVPGPLAQRQLQIVVGDGGLRLVGGGEPDASLMVAPQGFRFRGRLVAHAPRLGLSLWQLEQPPRVRTWVQGVERNGDVPQGGVATLDVFDCARGTLHLVAIGRDNESVQLAQNGNQIATTTLWPGGVWEQTVRTRAASPGTQCQFSVATTSLVHLATFAWTPG
jgi:hypothetical protein